MSASKLILDQEQFKLTISRLCYQVLENHPDFENTYLVGIQDKGVILSERITKVLKDEMHQNEFLHGKLDITFHRDDFNRRETPLQARTTEMSQLVEGKNVILIDDVLYTGRTIQAALSALQNFGRPRRVELLTLVDRRFNRHLPIQADYVGITVDSINEAYVKVEWEDVEGKDQVKFFANTIETHK